MSKKCDEHDKTTNFWKNELNNDRIQLVWIDDYFVMYNFNALVDLWNLFRINPLVSTTTCRKNIREADRSVSGFSENKTLLDNHYDLRYCTGVHNKPRNNRF